MRRFIGCLGLAFAIVCLLLAGMGALYPVEFLFNLAIGWALYCVRVLPQVHPSIEGILTAVVSLVALAFGMHWFLRWLHGQLQVSERFDERDFRAWPFRRTGVLLALIVLMFVAGIAAVGMIHQTAWLLTAPEPLVRGGRDLTAAIISQSNLRTLATAMHDYKGVKGTLPPAASRDREGRPLLSWRVLILPYLEEEALFKEFRLDEPWDGPHNLRLLSRMPTIYAPPLANSSFNPYSTHYQVFTGKGTAFEGQHGLRLPDDFPGGTTDTILIVEAAEAVPWTKPEDVPYYQNGPLPALGNLSLDYFPVVMADGRVDRIYRKDAEESIRARITRNARKSP